jgi:hypothetical protein
LRNGGPSGPPPRARARAGTRCCSCFESDPPLERRTGAGAATGSAGYSSFSLRDSPPARRSRSSPPSRYIPTVNGCELRLPPYIQPEPELLLERLRVTLWHRCRRRLLPLKPGDTQGGGGMAPFRSLTDRLTRASRYAPPHLLVLFCSGLLPRSPSRVMLVIDSVE